MAYIGKAPNTAIVNQATSQSFSGNGSATAFTLNRSVNVGEDLEVFVNNVQQEPGSGKSYTASGTTLTFDEAPPSGTGNIYVIYRGEATINPRLEHDANAALAATTGTFSDAVTVANGLTVDDDGATALTVDRATSDGTVIDVQKNGSSAGVIGTIGSKITIGSGGTGVRFNYAGIDTVSPWNVSTNALTDNATSLGYTNTRFKDLYLGGSLYIGGTGSANALDDYEIGNISSSGLSDASGAGLSFSFNAGNYVKAGDMVCFEIDFSFPSTSNGSQAEVTCLPFVQVGNYGSGTIGYQSRNAITTTYILGGTQKVRFASAAGGNLTNANMSGVRLIMTYIYRAL